MKKPVNLLILIFLLCLGLCACSDTVSSITLPSGESIQFPATETTVDPTIETTVEPTVETTVETTAEPTVETTVETTVEPTVETTVETTAEPTVETTVETTAEPTAETTQEETDMVWIPTKGGKKYHKKSTCRNMIDPDEVTIEEAEELGFTPCKKCYK